MTEYSKTAIHILDVTQDLIQKRGYHAISFNDIAVLVGIKKPSVIHHFPSKAALGVAVVKRYREIFSSHILQLLEEPQNQALDIFDSYCVPFIDFGKSDDKVCLSGALAGEFMALPKQVSVEVARFFEEHIELLSNILQRGLADGSFSFSDEIEDLAKHIINSLQGALIVKRATGNEQHMEITITMLKLKLKRS